MTSFLGQNWDDIQWMNGTRFTYAYDSNGNRTSYLYEYWNWNDSLWVNDWRYTYTYDFNGNMTFLLHEGWNDSLWVNHSRHFYNYDINGNMTLGNNEIWEDGNWIVDYLIPGSSGSWGDFFANWLSFYDSFGRYYYFPGTTEIHVYYSTITEITEREITIKEFNLSQNYPNPFNPSTNIEFSLPKSEYVELKVFNLLGQEVSTLVSRKLNQGNHTYTFDGKNLASGIYYYQLVAGDYRQVKKMVLIK
jgi:hypothetical protein